MRTGVRRFALPAAAGYSPRLGIQKGNFLLMADAISENPVLETSTPAAVGAGVRSSQEVTSIEIGLAIAFGMVFLFGVAAWMLELFGSAPGLGFAQALLFSQIATIGALIRFVVPGNDCRCFR
jgi:hypothetical protein